MPDVPVGSDVLSADEPVEGFGAVDMTEEVEPCTGGFFVFDGLRAFTITAAITTAASAASESAMIRPSFLFIFIGFFAFPLISKNV